MRFPSYQNRFYTCQPRPRRGGQAEVFQAEDDQGRKVAVKMAFSAEDAEWLDEERDLVTNLLARRPALKDCVVEILDAGAHEGRPFLVMPWYEHTLDAWLRREPEGASVEERLRVLEALAAAVRRLHEGAEGEIVHRDIKPSNVFVVGEDGKLRVLLGDFGAAGLRHRYTGAFNTGRHTEGFAPLDQVLPRRLARLDPSWDVHALACTVFFGLTGQPPRGVLVAHAELTAEGRGLLEAAEIWDRDPSGETWERILSLSALPLGRLADLSAVRPLGPRDRDLLRASLARGVGRRRAAWMARELVPALERALCPDPERRTADAGEIERLCARLREASPGRRWDRRWTWGLAAVGIVSAAAWGLTREPGYATVDLPPGTFEMGSDPSVELGWEPDEARHTVTLPRGFRLGSLEVTQGLYRRVMGEDPVAARRVGEAPRRGGGGSEGDGMACGMYRGVLSLVGDDLPVTCVTWCDAIRFANALSARDSFVPVYHGVEICDTTGSVDWDRDADGWRLPTEAEWEYAARAGDRHAVVAGSYQEAPDRAAREVWLYGNVADPSLGKVFPDLKITAYEDGYAGLAPPGSFQPNEWKLYDLTGNVREWVFDAEAGSAERVFRGSAFDDGPFAFRIANRGHGVATARYIYVGLRLARNQETP